MKISKFAKIGIGIVVIVLIISAVLQVLTPNLVYKIVSTPQLAQNTKVDIFQNLNFVLNKPITDAFFAGCKITIKPDVATNFTWQGTTLSIQPQTSFQLDTNYQLLLICADFNTPFQFTTVSGSEQTPQSVQNFQTLQDHQTSTDLKQVVSQKPWLDKLPLIKTDYVLVYDQTNDQYLITLSIPSGSKKTQADVQKEVLTDLTALNAPTDLKMTWR